MGRLRDWWDRVTGRAAEEPPAPRKPAQGTRAEAPGNGLELADDAPRRKPSRLGQAGFDPYSSDAGYSKPHSWERVDHD